MSAADRMSNVELSLVFNNFVFMVVLPFRFASFFSHSNAAPSSLPQETEKLGEFGGVGCAQELDAVGEGDGFGRQPRSGQAGRAQQLAGNAGRTVSLQFKAGQTS